MISKETRILKEAGVRTTNFTSEEISGHAHYGLHVIIDITAAAGGGETFTPKIQGYDAASNKWYDLLVGAAVTATGTTVLKVMPGIAAAANVAANDFIPSKWRVAGTHSASGNWNYTIGANILNQS